MKNTIVITRLETFSQPDGINIFIWHLAEEMRKRDYDVAIISAFGDRESIEENFDVNIDNIRIIRLSPHNNYNGGSFKPIFYWFKKGITVIKKIKPECILVNGAIFLPYLDDVKKVLINHDLDKRYMFQQYYEFFTYRFFDEIVTTTPELKKNLVNKYHLEWGKIKIIPVGVNSEKYITKSINEREHALLHVGTRRSKNLEMSIKILRILKRFDPEVFLYIVGPRSRYSEQLVESLKPELRESIKYLGLVTSQQLKQLYASVKLVLVPSLYETPVISPTVLESFASGTPVLGNSKAISKILLVHNYNGIRIEADNSLTSIVKNIAKIINNHSDWKRLSRNALYTAKKFDIRNIANYYEKLLN